MNSNKLFYIIDPNNYDYIILVKCIVFLKETILLMILISRVNILHQLCKYDDLNKNIIIDITKTGYTNNDTIIKKLQYFVDYTKNKKQSV